MTQYNFATGDLFTTTVAGLTPLKIGALQDVSVDFSADVKQLFGQYQFPLDVARGKTKVEGKAASGNVDVLSFNQYYFGLSTSSGQTLRAINEAVTIPTTPANPTHAAAHAADFDTDLGVYYADTGEPLTQVTSVTPAAGHYSVDQATGIYTFNATDDGGVLLNYLYTDTNGNTVVISNQLMGTTPKFRLVLSQVYDSKTFTLVLYSCVAEKLSIPLKQDDYTILDFSFQAQANSAGNIGYVTTTG